MDYDDIIYLAILLSCIGFGYFYREIKDVNQKKQIGTAVGLLVILLVSGVHIIHILVTFLINAVIILLVSKR